MGIFQQGGMKVRVFTLVFLTLVITAANGPLLLQLFEYGFDSGTYSHTPIFWVAVGFLLYRDIASGRLQPREGFAAWALIGLLVTAVLIFLSFFAQLNLIWRALFPALVFFTFASFFTNTTRLAAVVSLLFFAMPIWGVLTPILRQVSAISVEHIMQLLSLPTYIEGYYITIPEGTFVIADGCSGLRYFIVTLALLHFYAVFIGANRRFFSYIVPTAIIGALIANWLRIIVIIYIGHFSNMQSELVDDHDLIGWLIYFPMLWLVFQLEKKVVGELPTAQVVPLKDVSLPKMRFVVIGLCLALFSASSSQLLAGHNQAGMLSNVPASWEASSSVHASATWQPEAPEAYEKHQYIKVLPEGRAEMFAFLFDGRSENAKAMSYTNKYAPEEWIVQDRIASQGLVSLILKRRNSEARKVIVMNYQFGNKYTVSKLYSYYLMMLNAIQLRRDSIWRVWQMDCEQDCSQAQASLRAEASRVLALN